MNAHISDDANVPVKKSVNHLDSCQFLRQMTTGTLIGKDINKAPTHTHIHTKPNKPNSTLYGIFIPLYSSVSR